MISCCSLLCNGNNAEQQIINRIDSFYRAYIVAFENSDYTTKDSLKNEYCTSNLISFIEQASGIERGGIDYDVFLDAQDTPAGVLNTLSVTKESDLYVVSYFDNFNQSTVKIKLRVVLENGKYKIGSIILSGRDEMPPVMQKKQN
jgi:hypothetical protein